MVSQEIVPLDEKPYQSVSIQRHVERIAMR
jgi:hypothetical protein